MLFGDFAWKCTHSITERTLFENLPLVTHEISRYQSYSFLQILNIVQLTYPISKHWDQKQKTKPSENQIKMNVRKNHDSLGEFHK